MSLRPALSPSAASSGAASATCTLPRWSSRRTQLALLQFSEEGDSPPGPRRHSGEEGGRCSDVGSTRIWTVELHFTQREPPLMFCGSFARTSRTDGLTSKMSWCPRTHVCGLWLHQPTARTLHHPPNAFSCSNRSYNINGGVGRLRMANRSDNWDGKLVLQVSGGALHYHGSAKCLELRVKT